MTLDDIGISVFNNFFRPLRRLISVPPKFLVFGSPHSNKNLESSRVLSRIRNSQGQAPPDQPILYGRVLTYRPNSMPGKFRLSRSIYN